MMYINIHLCSSGAIMTVELLCPLLVQKQTSLLQRGKADSGGESRVKKSLQEKRAYIRFY